MNSHVTRIVLTGGPCAGKTTALARLVEHFSNRGYAVFTQPEAATLFHQSGANFRTDNPSLFKEIELQLLKFQLNFEDNLYSIASVTGQPALVLYDRGVMDIAAYLPAGLWQELLCETGFSEVDLRDRRYEAVLHLCTAAKGAEAYYTCDNNNSRKESPEEAVRIDDRLISAWTGHPHLRVIGNETGFEGKIRRVIGEITTILGDPEPVECERKFLVEVLETPPDGVQSEISQTYLLPHNGQELRIRKRGRNGNYVYFHTSKRTVSAGRRVEVERQISSGEYAELKRSADPDKQTIRKIRNCFVYDNQYFELDTFLEPKLPHSLLELEGSPYAHIHFPPFLKVVAEVTSDENYNNSRIADKKWGVMAPSGIFQGKTEDR
ncbi:MAG: AAA family ATPase [Bacteroidales bacterium]|nr:AAA family ATPase [Bacteroidales bacterium]